MKRRELLIAGALAGIGPSMKPVIEWLEKPGGLSGIPLVHLTDLYHPPQDPDDHIDLATIVALEEYDLKGVILDATRKFLVASPAGFDIQREPGFVPVMQLGYLLGRAIPVAVGPTEPLISPADDASDRPAEEQAGIRLLIDILEKSPEKVVVSVVGSARVLAAAFNRRPELLKNKIHSILLNAGSTGGAKREWNVGLDPQAYIGLWKSGLPIHWYPCSTETGAFNPDHERGTYWKAKHREIFGDAGPSLRAWFAFAFSKQHRADFIRAIGEEVDPQIWNGILAEQRNMWATASLVMGAGRVLARTARGWRFVPSSSVAKEEMWHWRLDPIDATVNAEAAVQWRTVNDGGNAMLFGRRRGDGFAVAMAEALNALLGTFAGH
jgi:hypothetical protein